ncbi:PilC/PilY family type IV pilus protein [Pseudoalteromonas sp. YIC-656]|uniref:pilus assembly protein n=1 Tax=Pseudoalteromonas pernae TaxID=3118054 RepID=UPI003242ED08
MKFFKSLAVAALVFATTNSYGEDIELYVGKNFVSGPKKPQVLIILDNSGSMNESIETPEGYKPDEYYEGVGAGNGFGDGFIFYTVGQPIDQILLSDLENRSDAKRFNDFLNGCDAAKAAIEEFGFYTGKMLEFTGKGKSGEWTKIKNDNGANMNSAVDCLDDILNDDANNQFTAKDGTVSYLQVATNGRTYTSASDSQLKGMPSLSNDNNTRPYFGYSNKSKGDLTSDEYNSLIAKFSDATVVTLFSPNYIRWYIDKSSNLVEEKKIEVAKEAIRQTLGATEGVDFALMLFNLNFPEEGKRDGGRIVAGFGQSDENIVSIVDAIEGETNTPLCETLFEAYNFYAGNSVMFGDDDVDCTLLGEDSCGFEFYYQGNTPPFDEANTTIDGQGNTYKTPFKASDCAANSSVIYITDGVPTVDTSADEKIASLPNADVSLVKDGSYLPVLSQWMYNNDVNTSVDGDQHVELYTIGFGEGAPVELLETAAEVGGGSFQFAGDGISLADAIRESLVSILETSSSFTAPSVASNNFDRTQTLNSVYYAMFLPTEGARWGGNLKKLKVVGSEIVDATGALAIDSSEEGNGNIKDTATTFWSPAGLQDGNDVLSGGAGYVLSGQSSRTVYSDVGSNGGLANFSVGNAVSRAGSKGALAGKLGVSEDEVDEMIKWARGIDVDDDDNDGNTSENRKDILGDPLHSRPLAVTYADGSVRVMFGTNGGFFHVFKDYNDTLTEEWSFIPYELYGNLSTLRDNTPGSKVYGIDGSASMYFDDKNQNGVVDSTDRVWVFIGMRRGGDSYYAFDLSTPSTPRLLWHKNSQSPGLGELGQTWSQPKVTFIRKHGNKPVLVVGAGYDTNKDSSASADGVGRGVYILDAETGDLVWAFTESAGGGSNTPFPGQDSIPGSIELLDSNYDGFTDRMYAADTGGHIWRFDMPSSDPTGSEPWTVFELADLGGLNRDRKFFYEPAVARTFFSQVTEITTDIDGQSSSQVVRENRPYEAVVVGSGNRAHPLDDTEQDYLFMIRDENTITQSFTVENTPDVINIGDLKDISADPFSAALDNADAFLELEKDFSNFKGWRYTLGPTEKALSSATVVGGVAYFSTFTPGADNDLENCKLTGGAGLLYAFHLHYGAKIYNSLTFNVGNRVPDTPQLFFDKVDDPTTTEEEDESQFLLIGVGGGEDGTGTIKAKSINENGRPGECGMADCDPDPFGFKTHRTYIYRLEAIN